MTLFFYGANTYALRKQLAQMVDAYRAKAGSDYGLERIDGATAKPRDLSVSLQASPFLASSRLVIVEGLASNKSLGDKLAGILSSVPETTVAVFVDREVDQRTTTFRTLSKADKVMKFEPLNGPRLQSWVKAEIEKLDGSVEPAAVRELIDTAGEDQWRLEGEVNKLVNYNSKVTVESVRELVAPSVERSIFDLVEAMASGRTATALSGYHVLLKQKESEIYILTMVQWQLRNLLLAKTAPNMAPAELAKAAGMSPYVAGKMMSAQSGVDEETLKRAFAAAADCEYDIKSGRIKAEAAVEQLIYRVSDSVNNRTRSRPA